MVSNVLDTSGAYGEEGKEASTLPQTSSYPITAQMIMSSWIALVPGRK